MMPLTENTPKPLIEVCGTPLIEHIVAALPSEITELVLVVNYLEEQIRAFCGNEYMGRSVTYVVQEDPKAGTGDALFCAESVIMGKFLLMYADDIHGAVALKKVVAREHCVLASYSDTPEKFGVFGLNDDGTLKSIIEKPQDPPSNFVNTGGGHVFTQDIFKYKPTLSDLGEYLLTDSITEYAQDHPVDVIEQELWIPVGCPEDIDKAEAMLCPNK